MCIHVSHVYSCVEGAFMCGALTCGSYSYVDGTFTCGTYSHVEVAFTCGSYSHVEGAFTCGTSHQSEILHSLIFLDVARKSLQS